MVESPGHATDDAKPGAGERRELCSAGGDPGRDELIDDHPSLAAWLALAGLWGAVGLGFAVGARARGRAVRATSRKPAAAELPDPFVVRVQQASLLGSCTPAVAALVLGAGGQAILWWALLALPASMVMASLVTPRVLALAGRAERGARPGEPEEIDPLAGIGALVCVPAVAALVLVLGGDARLAVAAGLIAGYGLWRGAYAARAG